MHFVHNLVYKSSYKINSKEDLIRKPWNLMHITIIQKYGTNE